MLQQHFAQRRSQSPGRCIVSEHGTIRPHFNTVALKIGQNFDRAHSIPSSRSSLRVPAEPSEFQRIASRHLAIPATVGNWNRAFKGKLIPKESRTREMTCVASSEC